MDILNSVGMFICTLLSHIFLRKFFLVRKVFPWVHWPLVLFFWAHPNKLFATYSFWLATLLSGLVTTVYREILATVLIWYLVLGIRYVVL